MSMQKKKTYNENLKQRNFNLPYPSSVQNELKKSHRIENTRSIYGKKDYIVKHFSAVDL